MELEIQVVRGDGGHRLVRLRTCTAADARVLVASWAPTLERGPVHWLDRGWQWEQLDASTELAFDVRPEWVVVADEVESDATGDLLGVLVTTGPIAPKDAGLDVATVGDALLLWVEYIATAPSIRPDCPAPERREMHLKRVGAKLMIRAIERSLELGCAGRLGLHAEGPVAADVYDRWKMQRLPDAPHPAGGSYPIFFGDSEWAEKFRDLR